MTEEKPQHVNPGQLVTVDPRQPIDDSYRSAKKKIQSNQILLTFEDEATAEYVRLVCRRKRTDLTAYILDNFEWDTPLECLSAFNESEKITAATCDGCEHIDNCPDAVKKKSSEQRR